MKNILNKIEVESRGQILALSLQVEDCLNTIIFKFFLPKSDDKKTKNIFLSSFVISLSFGQKISIYREVLDTERYKKILENELHNLNLINYSINDLVSFKKTINKNLEEIVSTRNHVAHGIDVSKGFLTLNEDEVILLNKFKALKISNESIDKFSRLVNQTLTLLNIGIENINE